LSEEQILNGEEFLNAEQILNGKENSEIK